MGLLTSSMTRAITGALASPLPQFGGITMAARYSVSGSLILDPDGNEVFSRGISQGAWMDDTPEDAAPIAALGSQHVRCLLRWWGPYSDPGIDSRNANPADGFINPVHFQEFMDRIDAIRAAGMTAIVALESDCGQYGGQSPENIAYCDPLGLYGPSGHNFWSDLEMRALYKAAWQFLARALRNRDGIFGFEILPEPRGDADASDAPEIRAFFAELRTDIRQVDPRTPIIVGPRSYEDTALEESYMGDYGDVIYTANLLSGRAANEAEIHTHIKNFSDFRAAHNAPVYVNQVGTKDSEDPGPAYSEMNGVLSALNALRMHWSLWEYKQHGTNPDELALYYDNGAGGYTGKTAKIDSYEYHVQQTLEQLITAAEAAATAAGWSLWYVKPDLSNVFQDSAGSVPCTALGQLVKRFEKVIGNGYFNQSGADSLAPVLSLLPSGRYGMTFDGVDDFLAKNDAFFTGSDGVVAIVAGECATGSSNRVALHAGTSGTTVRYPYIAVNASDINTVAFRGDDSVLQAIDGTITSDVRPLVITAVKSGNNKDAYINGFAEGAQNTAALGSIASMTRLRLGSTTSGTNGWNGSISLVCLGNSGTIEQIRAVERLGCFLQAGCYRGPIPA
jgi:hypothetical protein